MASGDGAVDTQSGKAEGRLRDRTRRPAGGYTVTHR